MLAFCKRTYRCPILAVCEASACVQTLFASVRNLAYVQMVIHRSATSALGYLLCAGITNGYGVFGVQGVHCDTVCRYYKLMKECWQSEEFWEYRERFEMYCVQVLRADEGVLAVQGVLGVQGVYCHTDCVQVLRANIGVLGVQGVYCDIVCRYYELMEEC